MFRLWRGFARSTFSSAVAFPGCAVGAELRNHGVQEGKMQCVMSLDVVIFHGISWYVCFWHHKIQTMIDFKAWLLW